MVQSLSFFDQSTSQPNAEQKKMENKALTKDYLAHKHFADELIPHPFTNKIAQNLFAQKQLMPAKPNLSHQKPPQKVAGFPLAAAIWYAIGALMGAGTLTATWLTLQKRERLCNMLAKLRIFQGSQEQIIKQFEKIPEPNLHILSDYADKIFQKYSNFMEIKLSAGEEEILRNDVMRMVQAATPQQLQAIRKHMNENFPSLQGQGPNTPNKPTSQTDQCPDRKFEREGRISSPTDLSEFGSPIGVATDLSGILPKSYHGSALESAFTVMKNITSYVGDITKPTGYRFRHKLVLDGTQLTYGIFQGKRNGNSATRFWQFLLPKDPKCINPQALEWIIDILNELKTRHPKALDAQKMDKLIKDLKNFNI
jgi:hypothetical protein